jgi:hypothetical protein
VFDEGGVEAGCLDGALGGRDPQRAGPHPDVLSIRIKPLIGTKATRLKTRSLAADETEEP